jgi:cytochrome c oxidase assembly protein subunit 15
MIRTSGVGLRHGPLQSFRKIRESDSQISHAGRRTKELFLKSLATPYNRNHHVFAVVTAGATFLLIIAGALVTSNDAGLSVPDWPTTFGSLTKMPHMVGGVKFEHGHRMVAEFVGVLTIILAIWTWRVERRRWLRLLALAGVGTVIAQGILGGITVLHMLPPAISTAHAALAQTFFCIAVLIALFTGRRWIEEQPRIEFDTRSPSLITLTWLSVFVLYVQLILGAMFRHHGIGWVPHVLHAAVVAFVLSWTAVRALSQFSHVDEVRTPAVTMLSLMIVQLCLGFTAFLTRVAWGHSAVQPELPMVISTVAHVAVGALLLATAVVLAVQVWRHLPVAFEEEVPTVERKAVAA